MEKILVLHHNDRDGYVSAAIVVDYYCNYTSDNVEVNYQEMDYSKSIEERLQVEDILDPIDEYKYIYIVDYSISDMDNYNFISKYKDKVVWIDHHKSSFDFLDSIDSPIDDFNGLRCIGASGALLTWAYFHEKTFGHHLNSYKHVTKDQLGKLIQRDIVDYASVIPMLVWYTHRYDIWDIDNNVEAFNFGQFKIDILYYFNWFKLFNKYEDRDRIMIQYIIEDGYKIKEYAVTTNEKHISQFGIPFVLKYKGNEYNVMMVNMPQPSSLKFGKYAEEYDILMPFYYNGDGCTYSMYKTARAPEELDVSEIACSAFNGGGHKNAAGFYIPQRELQLRPTKNSYFTIE